MIRKMPSPVRALLASAALLCMAAPQADASFWSPGLGYTDETVTSRSCFLTVGSGVRFSNTCTSGTWYVPLVVETAGTGKATRVSGSALSANPMTCRILIYNQLGTVASMTAFVTITTLQGYNTGNFNITGAQHALAECVMKPGSLLTQIFFSPN